MLSRYYINSTNSTAWALLFQNRLTHSNGAYLSVALYHSSPYQQCLRHDYVGKPRPKRMNRAHPFICATKAIHQYNYHKHITRHHLEYSPLPCYLVFCSSNVYIFIPENVEALLGNQPEKFKFNDSRGKKKESSWGFSWYENCIYRDATVLGNFGKYRSKKN